MDNAIKLYALYEDLDWWPISTWPLHMQNMAMSAHLDNRSGYRFFLFLVGNGIAPGLARQLLVKWHTYDVYQAKQLENKYHNKTLTGTYWDLNLKKIENF